MPHYLVVYDLNSPGQNYPNLIKHLESYPDHWHFQKSGWIIGPADSSVAVGQAALPFLDPNDKLFVQVVTEDCAWSGYTDQGSQWLRSITS
jgi:hypothetical protein